MKIKRRNFETGAAQLKRQMTAAGSNTRRSIGTDRMSAGTTQGASIVEFCTPSRSMRSKTRGAAMSASASGRSRDANVGRS